MLIFRRLAEKRRLRYDTILYWMVWQGSLTCDYKFVGILPARASLPDACRRI